MYIIAGLYRQRRLFTPKGAQTRPTASQLRAALFNICQNDIAGARFLDLFAGSGAVGLEALSRGAVSASFLENHKEAIRCIQRNIETLGVRAQTTILSGNVFQMLDLLERQKLQFDIIYADPPYYSLKTSLDGSMSEKIIRYIDQSSLLAPDGTLFIEEAFEFQPRIADLNRLTLKNSRRMGSAALQQYTR